MSCKENNEILIQGISAITDMVLGTRDVISVSIDDIKEFVSEEGFLQMSIGKASGENRARVAAQNALSSPLLSGNRIVDAMRVIVSIAAPPNFDMYELDEAITAIIDKGQPEVAKCIFGLANKHELEQSDEVLITVIACMPSNKKNQDSETSKSIQDDTTGENIEKSISSSEYANQVNFSQYDLSQHLSNDASLVRSIIEDSVSTAFTEH